jgi:hypothetical protein
VTEDFTRLALMPLFFAIEPSNESDGRIEFEIPAAWSGCLCLFSPDSFTAFVGDIMLTSN